MRRMLCLMTCMMLLTVLPASAAMAGTVILPMDLTPGLPLTKSCYMDEHTYEDPTVKMWVTDGFDAETRWWRADVTIAHPSQLRTMPANSFQNAVTTSGRNMSARANAVLAVNGDFFSIETQKKGSYVLRQGTLYSENLLGKSDVLLIDENGDFHVYEKPVAGDLATEMNGLQMINGFCFGPILISGGAKVPVEENGFMATDKPRARTALCQVGPLHYAVVCCCGPMAGSKGMTLQEFSDLLGDMDLQVAYNLDGGNSTMMYTGDRMINGNGSLRQISDMIYFASAWDGGE